jgi:thiosulfate/3-mercaptopyruvate sulfurtransferase
MKSGVILISALLVVFAMPAAAADLLVNADWLKQHINDPELVLIHVGPKPAFDTAHIPGAQLVTPQDLAIPRAEGALVLQLLPEAPLREKIESLGIGDASRVVVYFDGGWISPATRVLFSLEAAGLEGRVSLLDGGQPAWQASGGAVTAEVKPRPRGRLTLKPNRDLVASFDDVRQAKPDGRVRVIDARATEFFDGTSGGSMPRAGHIPAASSLPFSSLADKDLKMMSLYETRTLFKNAGVKDGDTVVSYCHIGQQATLVYFGARRLGIAARVYDGSWDEWSRRPEVSIETGPVK